MMASLWLSDRRPFLVSNWVLYVAGAWGSCYYQNEYESCCKSTLVSQSSPG